MQENDENTEKRAGNRDEGNIDKATKLETYVINRNGEKSACANYKSHDRSSLSHPFYKSQSLYIPRLPNVDFT